MPSVGYNDKYSDDGILLVRWERVMVKDNEHNVLKPE